MQNAIGLNDQSSAASPLIDIWIQEPVVVDDGTGSTLSKLAAPFTLSFAIFDVSTEANQGAPVQVFGPHNVDLTNDAIGGKVGHYAAAFSVSGWSPVPTQSGRFRIVWTYQLVNGGPSFTMTRDFDVLKGGAPAALAWGYCTVSDLRDEGYDANAASDLRLLRSIMLASKQIENYTQRFFEPRFLNATVDGTGGRAIQCGDPIIAVESITLGNPVQSTIGLGSLRVFNRHLSQRMTNPDDRLDPKIEFVHFKDIFGRQRSASIDSPLFGVPFRDLFFPAGVQNVNVNALFGYTDWDGSASGDTPMMIRHVAKLMAARELRKLTDDRREDRLRHRLTSERVRDQSYNRETLTEGPFTGDREIDDVLLTYRRPIYMGSP